MTITKTRKSQAGISMMETVIIFPILLMIGLGIVHLGLVYQAKANLEYAALMAARVGSVTSINQTAMLNELVRRITPSQIGPNAPTVADFSIQVLNPTIPMFQTCGIRPVDTSDCEVPAICEIPNYGLQYRPVTDECDGTSIQDANILRIKVTYHFNSYIPFMNVPLFASEYGNEDEVAPGVNVSAIATVRMQTPARYTSIFVPPSP